MTSAENTNNVSLLGLGNCLQPSCIPHPDETISLIAYLDSYKIGFEKSPRENNKVSVEDLGYDRIGHAL